MGEPMKYLVLPILLLLQTGCAVLTVADAAVTVVATTVKVGAKVVGAAVDAVIPDKEKDKKQGSTAESNN
jgi:hypothetical protein